MELNIKSDILSPQDKKTFEYSGYHVSRMLTNIPEMIKDSLRVEGGGIFEDKLKWDVSGDTIAFYSETRGKSDMDSHSKIWVKVVIQGSQNKKDKMGSVKISMKAWLETKFNVGYFTRPVIMLYNHFFYNNQRREYIDAGKVYIDRIEDDIRSMFNLMERNG